MNDEKYDIIFGRVPNRDELKWVDWNKRHHAMVKPGGMWAFPNGAMILRRTEAGWDLAVLMPYLEEMGKAAAEGRKVPENAEALLKHQRAQFAVLKRYNAVAGLEVNDPLGLLK